MSVSIPFCKTWTAPLEAEYVAQVLNGESATDGQLAESSSQPLEERLGVGRVLLTPSCTSALELAALLCEPTHTPAAPLIKELLAEHSESLALLWARSDWTRIRLSELL